MIRRQGLVVNNPPLYHTLSGNPAKLLTYINQRIKLGTKSLLNRISFLKERRTFSLRGGDQDSVVVAVVGLLVIVGELLLNIAVVLQ